MFKLTVANSPITEVTKLSETINLDTLNIGCVMTNFYNEDVSLSGGCLISYDINVFKGFKP